MADISAALIEQVSAANRETRSLKIVGGDTKKFMGRQTEGEYLHISKHSGIVSYQPTELVMTARAGTRIKDIRMALAEHNQIMAFEPPILGGLATLGGTLACNQSGPGRPWAGSIRDAVLGVRLINGRGEYLKFGGQVMKNVAGYDLSRLQAGAMGSLGVVTEVSFKVLPQPATTMTLAQELTEPKALALMTALRRQALPLTAACWFAGRLMLRFSGAQSAVSESARNLGGEVISSGAQFWHDLTEQQHPFFSNTTSDSADQPLWRFSVNPAAASLAIDPPPQNNYLIDWAGGQRWIKGDYQANALHAIAKEAKGHVSLYRGGNRKGEVLQNFPMPLRKLHQRLKQALDPNAILNPGRQYSWL